MKMTYCRDIREWGWISVGFMVMRWGPNEWHDIWCLYQTDPVKHERWRLCISMKATWQPAPLGQMHCEGSRCEHHNTNINQQKYRLEFYPSRNGQFPPVSSLCFSTCCCNTVAHHAFTRHIIINAPLHPPPRICDSVGVNWIREWNLSLSPARLSFILLLVANQPIQTHELWL